MLLSSYELIRDDPAGFVRLMVLAAIALVLAVTVHEFSHAAAATRLGDATARRSGRLSLNPLRHLDPGGTVLFFLAGFGWGKPVPVVQENLIDGRRSMALVAAAGPLSNVALAFLVAVPIKLGALFWTQPGLGRVVHVMTGGIREGLSDILGLVILFNLILAVFNLIPLSPLDGSKVLGGLLPSHLAVRYHRLEPLGPVVLVALIMTDYLFGRGILWAAIGPAVRALGAAATGY